MSKTVPQSCRWLVLAAALLAGSAGCSGNKLAPVQGKVSYPDGKPYAGGQVIFDPVDPANRSNPHGDIQEDGTFALGTNQSGDGAAPGSYKVRIVPPAPKRTAGKFRFPTPPIASPSEVTVATSGNNEVGLVVQVPTR
jgi:hypothetical protein